MDDTKLDNVNKTSATIRDTHAGNDIGDLAQHEQPLNGCENFVVNHKSEEQTAEQEPTINQGPPSLYGCFRFQPRLMQWINRPSGFLTLLCIFTLAQSTAVNGLVYVIISTLEKRFNLTSARSGSISSCFDFTVMAVVLFVTHFCEKCNKPLFIGGGALIFSLGSFVFTLPHFFTGNYEYRVSEDSTFCNVSRSYDPDCMGTESTGGSLSHLYWVFIVGQVLHGIGSSPQYPLGRTYVYENVRPSHVPLYLAIFQAVSSFGPAAGYILGGTFLGFYTDIHVDPNTLDIDPASPLWVGNWWLPFLVVGAVSLLVSIPLMAFPRRLPGSLQNQRERKLFVQKGSKFTSASGFAGSVKDFPRAVWTLVRNVPLMCINLGVSAEFFIISCTSVFGPKYIETQFSVTSGKAALLAGSVVIPSSLIGVILSGWILKRWDLQCRGQIKFCICALTFSFFMMFAFLLGCQNVKFAGVTESYADWSLDEGVMTATNLSSLCNEGCRCRDNFDPVCGSDGVMYYSPCHAGCGGFAVVEGTKNFLNCSCVSTDQQLRINSHPASAVQGKCGIECNTLPAFLFVVFLLITSAFLAVVPSITTVLSVVSPSQRSTAMGLQSLMFRALGSVPGPVIFGLLLDQACLLWETDCNGASTCWIYRNRDFSVAMFVVLLVCRSISLFFYIVALFSYQPVEETELPSKSAIK